MGTLASFQPRRKLPRWQSSNSARSMLWSTMPGSSQSRLPTIRRDDFRRLSETNLEGYIYISQLAVKQMLVQKTGGSVTCLTSAMVNHPIARVRASLPMITKGGLEAITLSLAMEYAKRRHSLQRGRSRIRRCTPMLQSLSPMGEILQIQDIVDAVVYLTGARHVTGEVLHVDAGAHTGKW